MNIHSLADINGHIQVPEIDNNDEVVNVAAGGLIVGAEPVFKNFPRSCIARGHIAGQTKAFANPSKATNVTESNGGLKIAATVRTIPSMAEISNALR